MNSTWTARALTAVAAASVMLMAAPASAASYWNSSAPSNATSVGNVTSKTVTIGGRTFTIQLRTGRYGNLTYFWARAPKDSDAYGVNLSLSVWNPSTKKWESRFTSLNKKTAYTDAHRSLSKYGYKACAKDSGLGGNAPVCTSARFM